MQPKTSGAGGSRGSRAGRRYVAVGRPQELGPADGTLRHSPQASLIVLAPRPCPVPRACRIVRPDPTDKPPPDRLSSKWPSPPLGEGVAWSLSRLRQPATRDLRGHG